MDGVKGNRIMDAIAEPLQVGLGAWVRQALDGIEDEYFCRI
jgi:hypothetical protein